MLAAVEVVVTVPANEDIIPVLAVQCIVAVAAF